MNMKESYETPFIKRDALEKIVGEFQPHSIFADEKGFARKHAQ